MSVPRVLIAGLRGGSGKTLVTVGLQAAWSRQGNAVAAYKKGPDYIDAAWSAAATGRPCRNLDLFLLGTDTTLRSFRSSSADADVAVIEGNRGLFDGLDQHGTYSTAELAKVLKAPVVLVVDCTKVTRTVAAGVLGSQHLDPGVDLRGVILNQAAGARHVQVARAAIQDATGLPVLGVVPRLPEEILPERHLGLVPPAEHGRLADAVLAAADLAERCLNLEALATVARRAPVLEGAASPSSFHEDVPELARIGVFRDAAFQFYYPENLEALERLGARLVEISPLRDTRLPEVDALYIGGGFPETLASQLADNVAFREELRRAAEEGLPVYAECGGAVYLGEALAFHGARYAMAGVLPAIFGFRERPQGHGYTVLETVAENPFYEPGETVRGHEFHYTYLDSTTGIDVSWAFRVRRGYGFDGERDGMCRRNVLACYTHVHALAAERWAPALVQAAVRHRSRSLVGAPTRP